MPTPWLAMRAENARVMVRTVSDNRKPTVSSNRRWA